MNKKELKIIATEEHRLYLDLQYAKKAQSIITLLL